MQNQRKCQVLKRTWSHATKQYEFMPDYEAWFHQWGISYEELTDISPQVSIAIVEDMCGQVHEVAPSLIKFVK